MPNPQTETTPETAPVPSPVPARGPGRPPVLDDAKRKRVVGLLASGCTRRIAANFVGCATSTLTRTILRNREFADEVARAEKTCELEALRNIRNAARLQRHWRAAAWLLERRNPADYGKRSPDLFTIDAVKRVVEGLSELAFNGLSEEQNKIIMSRMADILQVDPVDHHEPGQPVDPYDPDDNDCDDFDDNDFDDFDDLDQPTETSSTKPLGNENGNEDGNPDRNP